MNYNSSNQHLKLYEELVDKSSELITDAIKSGLNIAANHKNERREWKSKLNPKNFEAEKVIEFENVTQDALNSFHKRGQERMRASAEEEKNGWRKKPGALYKDTGIVQELSIKPNLATAEKSVGQTGFKRKYEPFESNVTPQISMQDKNLSSSHSYSNAQNKVVQPSNSMNKPEWKPKSNTNSFKTPDLNNPKKFESDRNLWPSTISAGSSHKFGSGRQSVDQPVRKYAQNVPPIKPHAAASSHNRQQHSDTNAPSSNPFRSAREELASQNIKKYGHAGGAASNQPQSSFVKRSLGTARKAGAFGKFIPPKRVGEEGEMYDEPEDSNMEPQDERLRNIEPQMIEKINNEIMYVGKPVQWEDIAGLEFAKNTIQEIVIWPLLRPDIFSGLRGPPKGILLFGPPGTGKTLIGKCIAAQSKSTFFSISASSLTSKWIGEGEKMVRALFAVARCQERAVIFIDEIDSLLSQRSESEHESSRRIKTEFLVQLDGATTADDERVLIVGATNRPQELDEAARRRLVKRLYIPLPESKARAQMVCHLMNHQQCTLSEQDIEMVAGMADGFSGADMHDLCREAAYGPIRSIDARQMQHIDPEHVRPINVEDFKVALQQIRPSVSKNDLKIYEEWNKTYGYGGNNS